MAGFLLEMGKQKQNHLLPADSPLRVQECGDLKDFDIELGKLSKPCKKCLEGISL
jgi:hypothetical protein